MFVNENLYYKIKEKYEILKKIGDFLEDSKIIKTFFKQANIFAVNRLSYNDHGIKHSKIVSGASVYIFDMFLKNNIFPSILSENEGTIEDARIAVFLGAFLHDIGNCIHRSNHSFLGLLIADKILDEILSKIYVDERKILIKNEILHIIYSHDYNQKPLTLEAEIVKFCDGLDMSEGRARIPYRLGKSDIHAFSALAIKSVEIVESFPIKIIVNMENEAGIFQIEKVLLRKLKTCSKINKHLEIVAMKNGKELKVYKDL